MRRDPGLISFPASDFVDGLILLSVITHVFLLGVPQLGVKR
jgi:hypothetical protein